MQIYTKICRFRQGFRNISSTPPSFPDGIWRYIVAYLSYQR